MGDFLESSSSIFDELHEQETIDNSAAEILESGDYSDEELNDSKG
jgi:hypothetical protein